MVWVGLPLMPLTEHVLDPHFLGSKSHGGILVLHLLVLESQAPLVHLGLGGSLATTEGCWWLNVLMQPVTCGAAAVKADNSNA